MRFGMRAGAAALAALLGLGAAASAHAGETWLGFYAHGVGTKQSQEGGFDTQIGYRTDKIQSLWFIGAPSVHILGSVNSNVRTDFVAVGFNWPLHIFPDKRFFIRPGIGFAGTNGEADIGNAYQPGISAAEQQRRIHLTATRIDFGSQDLFEPELAFGYHFTPKITGEISYVHLSNGQILHQGKNEGLDDIGARVIYHFGQK